LCTPPNRGRQRTLAFIPNGIEEETDEYKISLYPNPASDQLLLEYNLSDVQEANFIIYDVTGKLLYKRILKGGNNTEIITDLELASGVYLYQIITSDNQILKQEKLTIIK
jgi:Secretion system C-terminal sorting domain